MVRGVQVGYETIGIDRIIEPGVMRSLFGDKGTSQLV